jgi:hypothetical protein
LYISLNTKNSKLAGLVLSLLILLATTGCERDMRIRIDGKNPPTFTLSGSGNIVFLYVMKVPANRLPTVEDPKLWEIHPTTKDRISDLPQITYGTIPNGFSQTTPSLGQPPGLIEGQTYEVGGPAYNANGGSIWFVIKDGKSVLIPKPENYP